MIKHFIILPKRNALSFKLLKDRQMYGHKIKLLYHTLQEADVTNHKEVAKKYLLLCFIFGQGCATKICVRKYLQFYAGMFCLSKHM